MTNKKFYWLLICILLLALILRAPGLWWGYNNLDFFEPDEYQYFGIARNIINQFDNKLVPDIELTDQFNARALGAHMVWLGYPVVKLLGLPNYYLLAAGRLIALAYSLALLVLLAVIGRKIFNDARMGLLAALGLAVFDLNVTYSHYGVPDIPHVFWFYFSLYWIFKLINFWRENKDSLPVKEILWSGVGVAFSLSFRFQIVPLFALLAVLGWGVWTAVPAHRRERLIWVLVAGLLVAGVFYISVGFDYNWREFLKSKKELAEGALDIIQNGRHGHWLYNPFLYFMAILAGTSFLAVVSFLASLFYFFRHETKNSQAHRFVWLMLLTLFAAFIFLWLGDGTFVRHANIFLPALALLAAYGGISFYDRFSRINSRLKITVIVGVVVYTLGLTVFSQYYFVKDNRYEAAKFLKSYGPNKKIVYSGYAYVKGSNLSGLLPDLDNADLVVMHEALYGRYYKSFTVPLKRFPNCCQDTFLCLPQECSVIQSILKDETNYRLIKEYPITNPFPERVLFKNLFGTYETFLGDVLIYENQTKLSAPAVIY